MLLKDIVEKKRYLFIEKAQDWEHSIRESCRALVAEGMVSEGYADEIIACVKKHGPYIVIIPGFALPHSMENSANANGTAIGFTKIEEPVSFDENDPDKSARVFFTLASTDSDAHLKNMRQLFKMLTNEELCAELLEAKTPEDLLLLDEKYF